MIEQQAKEIRYFFYSQAFADGFRITFAILLPALLGSFYDWFEVGMAISLGALCVSMTDAPGPIIHKRNGMLFCAVFLFLVSFITPFARLNVYTMGLEIVLVSFFFSMFNVYGNRATSVGNAAILVMILTMDKPIEKSDVLLNSFLIFGGGIWYLVVSLLFYKLQPYRASQRTLGDCVREVASYLSIKADFYNPNTDLDADYKALVAQQIIVSEKQDAVRELLFKTRQIVDESTTQGRKLVWAFIETVDLFEDITASYYDYSSLRTRYKETGILQEISAFIKEIARELDRTGVAIQMNVPYRSALDFESKLAELKEKSNAVTQTGSESNLVLRKIRVNLRRLVQRFTVLGNYFESEQDKQQTRPLDHSRFISHQPLDPKILWNNITIHSSVFKHAARVAIACIVGYFVVNIFSYGHHSYWILMTIAFLLKPAFSLTKQRNIERIIGTIVGGGIGVLILVFIPNKNVQFVFMVLFMIGNYSFMRINYLAMVLFVTPFILILFNFLGIGFLDVAKERILDTVIGCAIAFTAGYVLFPTWESEQLKGHLLDMLQANANYLQQILEGLSGKAISVLEYKLVRKQVYVNSANLSAAFQRMLSEPKSKQRNSKQIHQFVVLTHIVSSNMATVATGLVTKEPRVHPHQVIASAKRSLAKLQEIMKTLGDTEEKAKYVVQKETSDGNEVISRDDILVKDQLDFIYKTIADIEKNVSKIIA